MDQETTDNRLTNLDIYAGLVMAVNSLTLFVDEAFKDTVDVRLADEKLLTGVRNLFEEFIANTLSHKTEAKHLELASDLQKEILKKILKTL